MVSANTYALDKNIILDKFKKNLSTKDIPSFNSLKNGIKKSCKNLNNIAREFKKNTKNPDILNASCQMGKFQIFSSVEVHECLDNKFEEDFIEQRYAFLKKSLKLNTTELKNKIFSWRNNNNYNITIDYIQTSPDNSKDTSFLTIYRNFDKKNNCINIASSSTQKAFFTFSTIKDLTMVAQTDKFNFDNNIDIILLNIKNKFKLNDLKSILMLNYLYSTFNIANSFSKESECTFPLKELGCK